MTSKQKILSSVALVIFVLVGMSWAQRPRFRDLLAPRLIESSSPEMAPFSARCEFPAHATLKFRSRAITTLRLAEFHGIAKNPESLAAAQMKFLRGFFHFSEIEGMRFNALVNTKVHVLSVQRTTYPETFSVDALPDDPSKYPSGFFPSSVRKGDPAEAVDYEAEIPVVACMRRKEAPKSIEVTLPLDPYLAFWSVSKKDRRKVQWGQISEVTNPCSYEQMADLKQPSMYWYVWNPLKTGTGLDCRELIPEHQKIRVQATFESSSTKSQPFSIVEKVGEEPVRVSLVFGYLGKTEIETLASDLELRMASFAKAERFESKDPGVQIASGVLNFIGRIVELGEWKVERDGGSFVFTTNGRLKESGRPIDLRAFLGPTVDYQPGTKHWGFLERALENSNFVFYAGHAGMGTSLTLDGLERASGRRLDSSNLPKYQFIAGLSCFATDYFGTDLAGVRSKAGLTTDVMLSGFEGHSFMMIPAVLQYLDLSFAGKSVSLEKSMERFLSVDQPVHVTRYETE